VFNVDLFKPTSSGKRLNNAGNDILIPLPKTNSMGDVKNLSQREGVEKMREIATAARVCHFVTALDTKPLASRPMSIQEVDDQGNFWFLSPKSSHKNHDINDDPEVQLFFANPSSSEFLTVFGYAEIIQDRKKLEEIWSPIAKTWFTEGKDDPEISILKVNAADAYYWDTKNNRMIQLMKIVAGAVAGKTMDDGIEGTIKP
jgi:general stress protein 26